MKAFHEAAVTQRMQPVSVPTTVYDGDQPDFLLLIILETAAQYGIDPTLIPTKSKKPRVVQARNMLAVLLRRLTCLSLQEISRLLCQSVYFVKNAIWDGNHAIREEVSQVTEAYRQIMCRINAHL